jgi:hypothetical protein
MADSVATQRVDPIVDGMRGSLTGPSWQPAWTGAVRLYGKTPLRLSQVSPGPEER